MQGIERDAIRQRRPVFGGELLVGFLDRCIEDARANAGPLASSSATLTSFTTTSSADSPRRAARASGGRGFQSDRDGAGRCHVMTLGWLGCGLFPAVVPLSVDERRSESAPRERHICPPGHVDRQVSTPALVCSGAAVEPSGASERRRWMKGPTCGTACVGSASLVCG